MPAARTSLGVNGGCVLVDDLDTAVAVANRYAPEHLQVAVADAAVDAVVDGLHHAGEILVGQHTPFSAANFVIGCPASLPTSGFAEVSSGITVEAFLKRTAVARADASALQRIFEVCQRLSRLTDEDVEELVGESSGDRSASNGSGSPLTSVSP